MNFHDRFFEKVFLGEGKEEELLFAPPPFLAHSPQIKIFSNPFLNHLKIITKFYDKFLHIFHLEIG
jgi:hypothetical protein